MNVPKKNILNGYFVSEGISVATTFYSIEKLSEGDISDIPVDTFGNLEELCWIAVTNSQSVE